MRQLWPNPSFDKSRSRGWPRPENPDAQTPVDQGQNAPQGHQQGTDPDQQDERVVIVPNDPAALFIRSAKRKIQVRQAQGRNSRLGGHGFADRIEPPLRGHVGNRLAIARDQ